MSYKSRFTDESFESYEERERVDTLFKIQLEKRLGRPLSYQENYDGRVVQSENRSELEIVQDLIWKPKTNDQRSNLEKIRDQCFTANDAALEAANKERDLRKRLAMYADIEIAKRQQQAAINAAKPETPPELVELREWQKAYRLQDVGTTETIAVSQAIQQFETENYCPIHAQEKYERAKIARDRRIFDHNAEKMNRIAALQQEIINVATDHVDAPVVESPYSYEKGPGYDTLQAATEALASE